MSFLTKNFGADMRSMSLITTTTTRNDIGETVASESAPIIFKGIILKVGNFGTFGMIENAIPLEEVSHTLRCDFGISIKRDDIIIQSAMRYVVKHVAVQEDFGGVSDHQIISLKHYE